MKELQRQGRIGFRLTVLIVESILSIPILAWAVYLIGPWFQSDVTSGVGDVLDEVPSRIIWATLFFLPCLALYYGLYKRINTLRMQSMLGLSVCFIFLSALRIALHGLFPITWLYMLVFSVLCGGMYLLERIYDD